MSNTIVKNKVFSCMKWREGERWGAWFRVYGYGLSISNMPLLFSQRNGHGRPFLLIGKVKITTLSAKSVGN